DDSLAFLLPVYTRGCQSGAGIEFAHAASVAFDRYNQLVISYDRMHRISSSADVFHVIADATRRGILDLLTAGERPASELGAPFRISQPAVSKHLAVLRAAGLVSQRREGG